MEPKRQMDPALTVAPAGCACDAQPASASASGLAPEAGRTATAASPVDYFGEMIDHCYEFAQAAKAEGRPIVGIMCEFTPRELILAAGGVPVCLCGGSAGTIAPAEQYLPPNLCPLIKSTFGYFVTGKNPFLEWADLVVAETTCDGKKKMFELLGQSKPMYVLELPQKSGDPDALERWVAEVQKFKSHLETRFEVKITPAKLHEAIQLMNRERRLRRELAETMTRDHPPLSGRQLLDCKSNISGIEADLAQYERVLEWVSESPLEAQSAESKAQSSKPADRVGQSAGRERKREVRVLLTGVPLVHGAERVLQIVEECGAVVVCMENCTGLKPILEDVDLCAPDPIRAIAEKYYHLPCSVMTLNQERFESLRRLAARYRPECIVELVWQACLTYDVESYQVRKLAEEELHLPYLKITTDYSEADSARIRARVEALLEVVRG